MLLGAVLLCVQSVVSAVDDYATWGNWRYVYLITKTAAPGANVTTTQTNFPVIIRINPGNFDGLGSTADDGSDIRFSSADGSTHLFYQKERWNHTSSTNDTGEFWVLVPSIAGNDTTKIRMYWNNSGAVDSSNGGAVFGTGNGFQAVWHLSEAPPAIPQDATINNNYGAVYNNVQASGEIGYGQSLNGATGTYIGLGSNTVLNPGTSNFTVSEWIKRGVTGTLQVILGKSYGGAPATNYGWLLTFNGAGNGITLYLASAAVGWGASGSFELSSSTAISDMTTWHHVAAVIDRSTNSNCKMYIDGADVTSITGTITTVGYDSNSYYCRSGAESDGDNNYNGLVDEARYENTTRTADWVKLCYQNQRLTGGRDSLIWYSPSYDFPARYTWDNSTAGGYQASSNTWSTSNAFWSQTGTSLVNWPGPGNTADFFNTAGDGNWTVTVSGTQYADSVSFDNSGYNVTGGAALYVAKKLSGSVFGFSPPYAAGSDSAKAFDGSTSTFCDDNSNGTDSTGID